MGYEATSNSAVININNSRIKGYGAIYLNGSTEGGSIVQTGTDVNVSNSTLTGTTQYSGSSSDFAVIAIDNTTGVNIDFTGTSSVVSEYTNSAQAKQRLIRFRNASGTTVTGSPTYTNGTDSTVNANALFISYGSDTNAVNDKVVARWITNATEFEAALASSTTTPIIVGRYEAPITTTGNNTLKTGVTLIIEDHAQVTIDAGDTFTNNGTIVIETDATFTNNGTINGSGAISETVGLSATPQDVTVGDLTINDVTGTGSLFVAKYDGVPSTGGLSTGVSGFYYDIQASSGISFPVSITLDYSDNSSDSNYLDENHFSSLFYYNGSEWKDYKLDTIVTTGYDSSIVSIDKTDNKITASLKHLTPIVPVLDKVVPQISNIKMLVNGVESTFMKPGDSIQAEADITDDNSGIGSVRLLARSVNTVNGGYIDSGYFTNTTGTKYVRSFIFPADGKYTDTHNPITTDVNGLSFYIKAYDNVGNYKNSSGTYFSYDKGIPAMSNIKMYVSLDGVSYLEKTTVKAGDFVRIEVEANDLESGVKNVEFRIQNKNGAYVAPRTYISSVISGNTYRFEYQVPTDGKYINTHGLMSEIVNNHVFWARAIDMVGNYYSGISGEFTYDITNPINPGTPSTTPNPTNSLTQAWTWVASTDVDGSGVKGYWQNIYNTLTFLGGSWSWLGDVLGTSTSLSDGQWQLWLKSEDNAGNISDVTTSATTTVDTVAPAKPTGLTRFTANGLTEYSCGSISQRQTLIPTWTANSETDLDHYEYTSFNSDGSIGLNEQVLSTNKFVHTWVPTADGVFGYAVRAVDKAGNKSDWSLTGKSLAGSCQIIYDSVVPTATISYSTVDWTNGNVTVTIFPSETVTVTNNGGSTGYTFITNGTFTFNFIDQAGNTGSAIATVNNIDTTSPTSSVSSPTYDAGGNISITFTASDSALESGVASTKLWFRRDTGSGFGSWTDSGLNLTGTSGSFAFSPSNIDGKYEFYSISTDAAGNIELAPGLADDTTLFDNTNPTGNWVTPSSGNLLMGTVPLEVSAIDNGANINSGVKQVRFRYKPTGGTFITISTDTSSPYVKSWDPTLFLDGDYILRAIITDNAGNTRNLDINVTLDNTIPVLSSQTTYSGWYVSDQVSDFTYTDLNGIASGAPVNCSITTEGTGQTCSVIPNVCDAAGNCNTTEVFSNGANIDKTNPTGTWINPIEGQDVSGLIPLNFSADDNISGVASIVYSFSSDGIVFTNIGSSTWDTTTLSLDDYILRAAVTDNAGNSVNFDENVGVSAIVSLESAASSTYGTATITWTTDRPTSTRVVYDTVSHGTLGASPNYGYAFSTGTNDTSPKVTSHSVTLTGLSNGTTYYYRSVSEGSPITVSNGNSFQTLSIAGAPSSSGGATEGQVQGASIIANNIAYNNNLGNEEVLGDETQTEEETDLKPTQKPTLKPEVEGISTKSWNTKTILLVSFGSIFILLALVLLLKKNKKNY